MDCQGCHQPEIRNIFSAAGGEDEKHPYKSVGYHTQCVKIKNVFLLLPFLSTVCRKFPDK